MVSGAFLGGFAQGAQMRKMVAESLNNVINLHGIKKAQEEVKKLELHNKSQEVLTKLLEKQEMAKSSMETQPGGTVAGGPGGQAVGPDNIALPTNVMSGDVTTPDAMGLLRRLQKSGIDLKTGTIARPVELQDDGDLKQRTEEEAIGLETKRLTLEQKKGKNNPELNVKLNSAAAQSAGVDITPLISEYGTEILTADTKKFNDILKLYQSGTLKDIDVKKGEVGIEQAEANLKKTINEIDKQNLVPQEKVFEKESVLRKEVESNERVRGLNEISDRFNVSKQLLAGIEADEFDSNNPAHVVIVNNIVRSVDTGNRVTQQEFATQAGYAALLEQVRALKNKFDKGGVVSRNVLESIVATHQKILEGTAQGVKGKVQQIVDIANENKLNPSNIVSSDLLNILGLSGSQDDAVTRALLEAGENLEDWE